MEYWTVVCIAGGAYIKQMKIMAIMLLMARFRFREHKIM